MNTDVIMRNYPVPTETLRAHVHDAERFVSATRILGGHGHTLVGHFLPTAKNLIAGSKRVELKLPDGDRLVGRHIPAKDEASRAGTVHVFHGLAGSTDSFYMPRAAIAARDAGFEAVLWNHRGCGEGRGLALETYHSGRSDDLARAIRWGRENRGRRQVMIGYSLSGNAACLLAARVVPRMGAESFSETELASLIEGATPDLCIAVNPPLDLGKSAVRLSYSPSIIYGQRFMLDLIECLGDRVALEADSDERKQLRDLAKSARAGVRPWQNVIHFDRAYTGKAAGFRDHSDYYARASAGQFLGKVTVPLILLTAADDPITHGMDDFPSGVTLSQMVILDLQPAGGHMGYVDRGTFSGSFRGHTRWLENRLHGYLRVAASQP